MGLSPYAMICTAAGEEKRIEDFRPGDTVREALTGRSLEVVNCLNSPGVGMMRIHVEGDIILDLTGDQNLLTDSGMLAVQRIAAGTGIRVKGGFARCTGVEAILGDYMVYDLVLENVPDAEPWIIANSLVVSVRQ